MKKLTDEERIARRKESLKRYAEKHPNRLKESQKKYKEAHPERRRATVLRWDEANKEKRHESYLKRHYENIEASRKRHAVNAQNRRARIKEVGGVLSKNIFDKLFSLQRGKCACCKIDLKSVVTHIDHIHPIALGGENSDSNVQLLCKPCNHQKSWRHPIDFMQDRGFLL
jgi:5-methylcytosine-specific restriction endonuclease McrA